MICSNCNRLIVLKSSKIMPGKLVKCVNCNTLIKYEEKILDENITKNNIWTKIKNIFS